MSELKPNSTKAPRAPVAETDYQEPTKDDKLSMFKPVWSFAKEPSFNSVKMDLGV